MKNMLKWLSLRDIFILIVVLFSFAINKESGLYTPDPVGELLEYISIHESNNNDKAVGGLGERGRHQIMPFILTNFNLYFGTGVELDMLTNKHMSEMVARYVLEWNLNYFKNEPPELRMVKSVSGYNTGYTLATNNVIRFSYVSNICPSVLKSVQRDYWIKWKGREYLKIGEKK